MTYTISTLKTKLLNETGYCFTDKYGHTIIQVYGEKNKLLIIKKLRK